MFTKTYLNDPDLMFLSGCDNADLKVLADILVYDKDDKPRYSEGLSKLRMYKNYYPNNLSKICAEIIHELQLYGGDTIVNSVRGHGVPYREILKDVCDKKKVSYSPKTSTERIEMYFVQKVFEESIDDLDGEDLKDLAVELGVDVLKSDNKDALKNAVLLAGMSPHLIGKIIAACTKALVPRIGVAFGGALLGKALLRVVPVINVISLAFLAAQLTGPAYRVTMPAVMWIIYLRRKVENMKTEKLKVETDDRI